MHTIDPRTTEVWADIEGWDGLYQVSSFGRVKSLPRMVTRRDGIPYTVRGCIRKPNKSANHGYLTAILRSRTEGVENNRTIHTMVLRAFVGPAPEGCEGAHIDGDKSNNALYNLEYKTHSDNLQDKHRHGTACGRTGPKSVPDEIIRQIRIERPGLSLKEMAAKFNLSGRFIQLVCAGKSRSSVAQEVTV